MKSESRFPVKAFALVFALVSFGAFDKTWAGEGCPEGWRPTRVPQANDRGGVADFGCVVEPDVPGSQVPSNRPARPTIRVQRYGAFAYSPENRKTGSSADSGMEQVTQAKADRAAIEACALNLGGIGCEVIAQYANECLAVVMGAKPDFNLDLVAAQGKDPEKAEKAALKICEKNLRFCELLRTDCALDEAR
jgi:hypothetical protein